LSHKVYKLSVEKDQLESNHEQALRSRMGVPRRVLGKGMQGVDVAVVVRAVQGTVWVSISPPFTWEAIMEPRKVDEMIHVLELAREEAKKMAAVRSGRESPGG
jgi:hypothetical protein